MVRRTLQCPTALIVPSRVPEGSFQRSRIARRDRSQHHRSRAISSRKGREERPAARHLVVARNLEPIYDVPTALRAFALIRESMPDVRLTIAGSARNARRWEALCRELCIEETRISAAARDRDEMATPSTRSATIVINPSRVDNMPNSVLEAMASGVPVVSTNVGGVPFILRAKATQDSWCRLAARRPWPPPCCASSVTWNWRAGLPPQRHSMCNSTRGRACGSAGRTSTPEHSAGGRSRASGGLEQPAASSEFLHARRDKLDIPAPRAPQGSFHGRGPQRPRGIAVVAQRERLASLQLERLAALLRHANDHVPYYRDLFRRIGFDPRTMTSLADLERLPFLTKAEIRAHTESLKSSVAAGLARSNTGGSSGELLVFFLGKER